MANQTIYPYGTGGSMPDGYSIINDLTTGGTNKALSAEMGKRLGPLDDLVADVTNVTEVEFTNGKYYKNYGKAVGNSYTGGDITSTDTYACAKVSAQVGDVVTIWVYNVPNVAFPYIICNTSNVITEVSPKSSSSTGYTKAKSDPWVLTIEEDCYIYINTRTNGGDGGGCTVARDAREIVKADSTHDGIMTTEHVAALEYAGGADAELLRSYLVDRTDTIEGSFVVGDLKNWNVAIGATYNGGLGDDNQNFVYCVFSVMTGDIVTFWCTTDAWNQGYIICDSSNKVIAKSGNNYSKSQASPAVITIEQNGKIWIASNKGASYGASLSRTYRAFRKATSEQDGLMSKEIAALFGGDVSGDDAASLKLKSFAFIGDSFSAPNSWQSTMCSDLGSIIKSNRAVSGGAWHGTDSLSAYYQAQQLVSSNQAADYILCVLGTNDIAHWATYTLGNIVNSETIGTSSGNVNPSGSITGGIQATLITLKNAFPNAIIKIGYTPAGYIHDAFNSIANVEALCDRLKELSHIYGVGYIETRDCGICPWMDADLHAYTGTTSGGEWTSTGHPSGAGQTRIGHYMARIMLSNL